MLNVRCIMLFIDYQFFVFYSSLGFFFFKQKTAYEMRISYWSSDVCSSDLAEAAADHGEQAFRVALSQGVRDLFMRRSRDHTRRARLGPELDDVAHDADLFFCCSIS